MSKNRQEKTRKPWWRKLMLAMSPLFLLLVAALLYDASAQQALDQALAEARAGGEPVTFEELEAARKQWPDDENGAHLIEALRDRLTEIEQDDSTKTVLMLPGVYMPELSYRWSGETDRAVADLLQRTADALDRIDQLANYQGGRFAPIDPSDPMEILFPDLDPLRTSARLKFLQTVRRAMAHDTTSLINDVRVLQCHGQLVADEPSLVSSLIRVACDALSVMAVQQVLAHQELTPLQLSQLDALLADLEDNTRLYWGIRGERAFFLSIVEGMRGNREVRRFTEDLPAYRSKIPLFRGILMKDEAFGLRLYNRKVRASDDSREAIESTKEDDAILETCPRWYIVTRTLVHSFSRAFELDLRLTAEIRSAQAALAAERYRLDKGAFPGRLDQLVPDYIKAVPADPFDDKPLRYRVNTNWVIFYSIGEDMFDNEADVDWGKPGTQSLDVGFILLRPECRGRLPMENVPTTRTSSAT